MAELKSLDDLFKGKIFRIPDYQRGYAWQISHLRDFWEDLINLPDGRSHYTGVLTLKDVSSEISEEDNEYWLVKDPSYKMYHIVDGQQRLATFVVFLQAFIDFVKDFDEISDKFSLKEIISHYLYKKPTGGQFRTYKFGYTVDNPSYDYLRYEIFNEGGSGSITKTFYTLNLKNAKLYFSQQLKGLHSKEGLNGLQEVYEKLTKRFLFNEYVIEDELDVFVAFETMNNRGKHLSNLELLKNRLIYLTTLYTDDEIDLAERQNLRQSISDAWKEVYHQLGRNEMHPLNDDEFLRAHWIMYFEYSRTKGDDYIRSLLDKHFSPQKVHKKIVREVDSLELPEERRTDFEINDTDIDNGILGDAVNVENDYIDFVNISIKSGKIYAKAIRELEHFIEEPIFNSYSLDKLRGLKERLSSYGDLHDFNVRNGNQASGAAIGKLIEFHSQNTQSRDIKTDNNGILGEAGNAENDYIDFVNSSTKVGSAGKSYMKAIRKLEGFIEEPIFNSYSLDKLRGLRERLSSYGDLHDFNVRNGNRAPGAAIGKLIAFHSQNTQSHDIKIDNNAILGEAQSHDMKTDNNGILGEAQSHDIKTEVNLKPLEIKEYVDSLKESAVHWFNSHYPDDSDLSDEEKDALNRLNRIGMIYFRPLVMSVLKNEKSPEERTEIFDQIERFIFIAFRLNQSRSNYRSSEFYVAARELNRGKLTLEDIEEKFKEDPFKSKYFRDYLYKRFDGGNGYYGWHGLRYFLYEYELHLLRESRHRKMPSWEDLLRTRKDKISIEHIFPQTPTESWKESFADIDEADYPFYSGSIGNLLLLSGSINSALQNADFADKKNPKFNDADKKIRNGYSDGSHSEIEVSRYDEWTPAQIEKRGLRLLDFMEERWNIKFESDEAKKSLLFPGKKDEVESEQSD